MAFKTTIKASTPIPAPPAGEGASFFEAIQNILQEGLGQKGDPEKRFITLVDLTDSELIKYLNSQAVSMTRPDAAVQDKGVPTDNPPDAPRNLKVLSDADAGRLGAFSNHLVWDNPVNDIDDIAGTQIWVAETQNRSDAVFTGLVTYPGDEYVHAHTDPTTTYYYWIRSVNWAGQYSEWEPTSDQGGLVVKGDATIIETIDKVMDALLGESPANWNIATAYVADDLCSFSNASELLKNTSFETGDPPTDWTEMAAANADRHADAQAGSYCLEINETGTENPYVKQAGIAATEDKIYILSCYIKQGTAATYKIELWDVTNGATIANVAGNATAAWVQQTVDCTIPADCTEVEVRLTHTAAAASGTTVLFDVVSLKLKSTDERRYKCATANTGFNPANPTYWTRIGILVEGEIDGEATVGVDGNMVVDGTIITRNLDANCVTADVIAANTITAAELAADSVTATEIDVVDLSAISADIGTITAGKVQNTGGTNYVDLDAAGANPFIKVGSEVTVNADGSGEFARTLVTAPDTQASGTVSGLSYTSGTNTFWRDTGVIDITTPWSAASNNAYIGRVQASEGSRAGGHDFAGWMTECFVTQVTGFQVSPPNTISYQGQTWSPNELGLRATFTCMEYVDGDEIRAVNWAIMKV